MGATLHRQVAGCLLVSFGMLVSTPQLARADQPIDPYGPYPPSGAAPTDVQPIDPYGPYGPYGPYAPYGSNGPGGPRLPNPLVAPPPQAPPAPLPYPSPSYDPYQANPYAPGSGTCPVGCPQAMQPPLTTYQPTPLQTERRPRYGLMAAGISIFAVSWISTASSAYYVGRSELAIPLAGPIVTAIDINRNSDYRYDTATPWATGALVFDALVQTAGFAMIIAGAVSRKTVVKRQPYTQPTVYPYGAGVTGTF